MLCFSTLARSSCAEVTGRCHVKLRLPKDPEISTAVARSLVPFSRREKLGNPCASNSNLSVVGLHDAASNMARRELFRCFVFSR